MTRFLHFVINSRRSWNCHVLVLDQAKEELVFWRDNLKSFNGKLFWPVSFVPSKVLFSDASSTGCAAFIQDSSLVCQRNWSVDESRKSSTWRELAGIHFALEAFENHLIGQSLRLFTDNQNVVRIIQVGSMIQDLQVIALNVFLFVSQRRIQLDVSWLPREQNSKADFFSKIIDVDDYSVHDDVFVQLDELWGPHTVDRFACCYNTKLPRFNSRFLQPGTEAVDAFSQDWSSDINWLVPPVTFIGTVLSYMRSCKARGTLVVPMWRSACFWVYLGVRTCEVFLCFVTIMFVLSIVLTSLFSLSTSLVKVTGSYTEDEPCFWPLLCTDGVHFNSFVADWMYLPNRPDLFVEGRAKNSLFSTDQFKSRCLALRIAFPGAGDRRSNAGFCTSPEGFCLVCQS